ncbi:MAG: flagellar basal body P-ring formation chaperone FlgA [Acidobacteriota bacterium]
MRSSILTLVACIVPITLCLAAEPRPSRTLAAEDILAAMRLALGDVKAEIEILEISHFPAPEGEIEFALTDLTAPSSVNASSRWRGFVRGEGERKFSIWAVVRVTAECQRVVATERLEVGQPILARQVREETYLGFPFAKHATGDLTDFVGRAPLRTLRTGSVLNHEATAEPILISNGSNLLAEFRSGRLRITVPVVALGSGRVGELISVRNPESKKIFAARVNGPGRVVVEIGQ